MHDDIDETRNVIPRHAPAAVPAGSVLLFSGVNAPLGWLVCDGKRYTSRQYPELFEVIQTTFVTPKDYWIIQANQFVEEKLFCVPDMRGRVPVGIDNESNRVTSSNNLGESGGEEKHQLTIEELAKHSHEHYYGTWAGGNSIGNSLLSHPVNQTQQEPALPTGGNRPHNNMQPYLILNYIIKY